MRVAFSGAHRVGKSTLIEAVAARLPGYATIDEPYHQLEEEGHDFAEEPSLEDFEAQLARSISSLDSDARDVLFDRCPADLLAYLRAHDHADAFDADAWLDRARAAIETLDLIVLVPIEEPDRIALPAHEDRAYRRAVDETLRDLLEDAALGDLDVLIVGGDLRARADQVLARVTTAPGPAPASRQSRSVRPASTRR